MLVEHFDVLIVGGGLSGVGAACSLQKHCPHRSYAILEARSGIGGTWDLFRYPGVRSDSDMYTLGYSFRPWAGSSTLADGPSILQYIRQTASENGIDRKVRYHHRVTRAAWNSELATWTVNVERGEQRQLVRFTCHFLIACSGYYRYDEGYSPHFAGSDRFAGTIVHPQQWPAQLAYANKRIVVIGSGATAVTLVPALAQTAAHVTMLQRSPTYIVSAPTRDAVVNFLRRHLPARLAYRLIRWRSVLFGMLFYQLCRRFPAALRHFILQGVRRALGAHVDVARHFTPGYNPWDQRLCLVPDGDLFHAIKSGKASVRTGQIDCFTAQGVKLQGGEELPADVIITATGLNLLVLGNIQLEVDGRIIDPAQTISYKGALYSGVPNLASVFGYTNASWTLKCELTCEYLCRVLNFMQRTGRAICVPTHDDPLVVPQTWLNLTSGYIQRSVERVPKQGSKKPWKLYQNYLLDLFVFRYCAIDDGVLRFHDAATPEPVCDSQK
jgi:cation diffusion facilitator CzcD-associated flavoprotein CzcO